MRRELVCVVFVVCWSLAASAPASAPQAAVWHKSAWHDAGRVRSLVVARHSHSHAPVFVHLGNHTHTNASTHGTPSNGTAPQSVCTKKIMEYSAQWEADSNCNKLANGEFDEHSCENPCFNAFVGAFDDLHKSGCIDSDLSALAALCEHSQEDCASESAVACVEEWIAHGCEDDEELFSRCAPYAMCAYLAEQAGRCLPPSTPTPTPEAMPTPTPILTCRHLNNCSHHGHCSHGECVCNKGYGRKSLHVPQDCSEFTLDSCPNMCHGHGECVPKGNNTMVCKCYDGFSGVDCDMWTRCASLNFCSGNGVCTRSYPVKDYESEHCVCSPGFSGVDCSTRVESCPDNCNGHGTCIAQHDGARFCNCDSGYSGADCGTSEATHCPNSCSGFGSCKGGVNCTCIAGAHGSDCSHLTNECTHSCGHGFCKHGSCQCQSPFTGDSCATYDAVQDHLCASLDFCSGKGVCSASNGAAQCVCFDGFKGVKCNQVDSSDVCPNFCNGHGRCVVSSNSACVCHDGWSGAGCSVAMCATDSSNILCGGRGICEAQGNGQHGCTCDPGWTHGPLNTCEVSTCPNGCSDHGKCNPSNNTCVCDSGFSGNDCSQTLEQTDSSAPTANATDKAAPEEAVIALPCPNDCNGHGICNDGVCECTDGFVGLDCSIAPIAASDDDDIGFLMQLDEGTSASSKNSQLDPNRISMAKLWD